MSLLLIIGLKTGKISIHHAMSQEDEVLKNEIVSQTEKRELEIEK
jgi:hypothetical protein